MSVVTGTSRVFASHVTIIASDNAPVQFAAKDIAAALKARGDTVTEAASSRLTRTNGPSIVLATATDAALLLDVSPEHRRAFHDLKPEGFSIRKTGTGRSAVLWIIGHDPGGAMYGGLDAAEQIRIGGLESITSMDRTPYMAMRGVKFNIPLDVRTPSYSDMSDAGQANIPEMWNFDFWRRYLDALARDRYNYVSLWNLHPFPSMVQVPDYPDVALADVKRSTIRFDEDYPTVATGLSTPEMNAHAEVIKKIPIGEKIAFWRRVMQYAKDRNIDIYIITWNVYTYGVDGKYGITDALDNPVTIDYFRKSVAQMFRTYPLLRGIGLTTGENMGDADFQAKENWAFATYGQGVLDVAREQPDRLIRLIHRQHQTSAQNIARTFAPLLKQPNVDFVFSFKYAQAHALSSTVQPFAKEFVDSLGSLKTFWEIRNDDALMLRWGAPDFVRQFIKNIPHEVSLGLYAGSDMWIWGRDFLSLHPSEPDALEIDRQWYHWMLWGRLGYDPRMSDARITEVLHERFPSVDAPKLFDAWQHASMIYPLTTGFHWADFDFQWYIEGCRSRPGPAQTASGFHDVNRFITLGTHPGTGNVSIPRYVEAMLAGQHVSGTTPLQVADQLDAHAGAALRIVDALKANGKRTQALAGTLSDIRAMALLGQYYAEKIRGATALALFRSNGDAKQRDQAVERLRAAAIFWNSYTTLAASKYRNPLWTNRVGRVVWNELNAEVARDIEIARASTFDGANQ